MQPTPERLPRVILVDDDAPIRQFVSMALEDQALHLWACPNVHSARQALENSGTELALVLLDMMLPDGSGMELLKDPVCRQAAPQARWVVFSAGVAAADRQALAGLNVYEVLDKPAPLDRLVNCVELACQAWLGARGQPAALCGTDAPSPSAPMRDDLSEAGAIQTYFMGQEALFRTMKEHALRHLPADIEAIESLLAREDAPELRRAAHNLKSIAHMLGQTRAAGLAQALEDAAARSDRALWKSLWQGLHGELKRWGAS